MVRLLHAATLLGALVFGTAATSTSTGPAPNVLSPASLSATVLTPSETHALIRADVEAYFDGFFPDALARADIAGAVVVVVKDGQVLLEKGYGYSDAVSRKPVDPKRTLFRPGSISKLFTWTAVMQLVEQGKLDLDRDVNAYLDFQIPATWPEPITLRNLLTHTPGFEEHLKGLMVDQPSQLLSLRAALVGGVPNRIYPPGKISAYSNYGAALAGYIVQRVSGERFEDYVARNILAPLRMDHSTFQQPLPEALAADMSKGYFTPERPPQTSEFISMRPAGALSATGDDIARFMIAHLNDGEFDGAQILKPETAKLMHGNAFQPVPPLPAMALGFYHEDRNGRTIVGHGGDTQVFHSDLHLIPDEHVGLFVSLNSLGSDSSPITGLRTMLLDGFMDRYFPAPPPSETKPIATAKADAELIAGSYEVSRRSETNFMRVARFIQQMEIVAQSDGSITIPFLTAKNGPKKWIEVAPFVWREEHGTRRVAARIEGGRVLWVGTDMVPPILVLQPVPFWRVAKFNYALLAAAAAMLALTALFWPLKALLRWRYERPFGLAGRRAMLYRLTRIVAVIDVALLAGWGAFLLMGQAHLAVFDAPSDRYLRGLQILGVLGLAGAIVPTLEFVTALRDPQRPWWTKATDGLVALAALSIVWFVLSLDLITRSLNY
jgi:CubicO group peptidase (beta-lactamase class C family)